MKIKTLIIGAGNISAFYDSPHHNEVLTHAHAIINNNKFELIGFVDIDIEKAQTAAKIWGGEAFNSIDEVSVKIDCVCIAVPDKYHFQVTQMVIEYAPKIIIIEKPIAIDATEGKALMDLIDGKPIHIEVNYSRRFITGFSQMKAELPMFGKLLGGTVLYGKGLLHNGSHMVNLLLYFLGQISMKTILGVVEDYHIEDCSKEIVYSINGADIIFHPVDSRFLTIFEFDLRFSKGRIKYDGSVEKLHFYDVDNSPIYLGEQNYVYRKTLDISASEAMINLYLHISNVIEGKASCVSSAEDAYKTLLLCK